MNLLDIDPRNPLRPPNWRWLRAAALHNAGAEPHRCRDDRWTKLALRLRKRLDSGVACGLRRLRSDADHDQAYRLRFAADPRGRWEAEARLLAGQGPAAIADRLELPAAAVELYQAIFFDVAAHLEQIDYIATFVFGPRACAGLAEHDADLIAKLLGFHLGPAVVDALARHWRWPSAARVAPVPADEAARTGRALDRLIASMTLPVDGADALHLLRVEALAADLDRAAAGRSFAAMASPTGFSVEPPVVVTSPGASADAPVAVDREEIVEVVPEPISRRGPYRSDSPLAAVG